MDITDFLSQCLQQWGSLDWNIVQGALPDLARGLIVTVELSALSLLIGICLAVPLSLLRVSKNPFLWTPVYAYTYFFRGTPLLIQLFLIYYGAAQFEWLRTTWAWTHIFRGAFWPAVIAYTLNTLAYTTEILRGAIQAVPLGEIEAAKAQGMSNFLLYRRIILPKAFRIMLPAYSNEIIFTLQASSIASIVTLLDLTGVARIIIARTFGIFEIFLTIAAIYLALTYLIAWLFRIWEHHWSAHLRERPSNGTGIAGIIVH